MGYAPLEVIVLFTLAVVLLVFWLLGFVTTYTMGGSINLLFAAAIVVVLWRFIAGRKPLNGW